MINNHNDILKNVNFIPNKQNLFVWFNVLFVLVLLISGRADGKSIVFAFFFETIIIGIFHIIKLYSIYRYNKANKAITRKEDGLFAPIFFSFHYGFFVAIQLIFVFAFMDFDKKGSEPFHLISNISYVITNLKGIKLVLISLLISNFLDHYYNFIQNETYKKVEMEKLFFQPYVRIIIQQFAVIIGGFFMIFKTAITIIAILIIVFKALIDLYFLLQPNNNITRNKITR